MQRQPIDFYKKGWQTFHRLLCFVGASVSDPDWDGFDDNPPVDYVNPEFYEAFAGPILDFCSIERESLPPIAKAYRLVIWRRLKTRLKQDTFLWKELTQCKSPAALINRFRATGLQNASDRNAPFCNFAEPRSIASYAMWLVLTANIHPNDELRRMAWGLALIGWATNAFQRAHHCALCFRTAWPGQRYCGLHSQSRVDEETASTQAQNYRLGMRVTKLAKERGVSFWPEKHEIISALSPDAALTQVLFPRDEREQIALGESETASRSTTGEATSRHALLGAIRKTTYVFRILGSEEVDQCSYRALMGRLQERLDPHRMFDGSWLETIELAEVWFGLAAKAAPGKRGRGVRTDALIEQAIQLAAQGVSKGAIARALGLSKSALSNWIRRYPELEQQFVATKTARSPP